MQLILCGPSLNRATKYKKRSYFNNKLQNHSSGITMCNTSVDPGKWLTLKFHFRLFMNILKCCDFCNRIYYLLDALISLFFCATWNKGDDVLCFTLIPLPFSEDSWRSFNQLTNRLFMHLIMTVFSQFPQAALTAFYFPFSSEGF